MTHVAYGIREGYRDTFVPGTLNIGGEDYDLAAELDNGAGYIVVDTSTGRGNLTAEVLDGQPALKRVPVSQANEAREKASSPSKPRGGKSTTSQKGN